MFKCVLKFVITYNIATRYNKEEVVATNSGIIYEVPRGRLPRMRHTII